MKLSEFKAELDKVSEVVIKLPDGTAVPNHFHVTEVGQIEKRFIDCGGTIRKETRVNFQLWKSVDIWHRLAPQKLIHIIDLSQKKLGIEDHEIEVEYQGETINKYGIDFDGEHFTLTSLSTACLAEELCGIPTQKVKESLALFSQKLGGCCGEGSSCC